MGSEGGPGGVLMREHPPSALFSLQIRTGMGGRERHPHVPGCNSAHPRVQALSVQVRCQEIKRIFGSGTLVRDQAEDEQVTVCMFGICES